ncbi:hypothetical protein M0R45_026504 [Rubus argutus]|uniref:Uncharacterized protein n=1 Tax=Rubus argutus TaxID=59490 RepID=A0AAW1X183_RUBAR
MGDSTAGNTAVVEMVKSRGGGAEQRTERWRRRRSECSGDARAAGFFFLFLFLNLFLVSKCQEKGHGPGQRCSSEGAGGHEVDDSGVSDCRIGELLPAIVKRARARVVVGVGRGSWAFRI